MNNVSFSRGISTKLRDFNLLVLHNTQEFNNGKNMLFRVGNTSNTNGCVFEEITLSPNLTKLMNLKINNRSVILTFDDNFVYIYTQHTPSIAYSPISLTYLPTLIHSISDMNITNTSIVKPMIDKIGVANGNILRIYVIDKSGITLVKQAVFPYKIIDYSKRFIILRKDNRNIIFDINKYSDSNDFTGMVFSPLISNYMSPDFIVEVPEQSNNQVNNQSNSKVYLIDSSSGTIMSFNPNTLTVKKMTTIPGYITKVISYQSDILFLTENNKNASNGIDYSILHHIINTNNVDPLNGIAIYDTDKESLRYSINLPKEFSINDLMPAQPNTMLIDHTNNKLNNMIIF